MDSNESSSNESPTKPFSPVGSPKNNDSKEKEVKIRKIVRKPQPKLDSIRLTGERGIRSIMDIFKDVKFKGEGYEFRDLDLLISKYKLWAHRLFPKMTFEEVLERIEKLVEKKEVKHCINRVMNGEDLMNIANEEDDLRRILTADSRNSSDEEDNTAIQQSTSAIVNSNIDDDDEAFYNAINMYNI